MKNFLLSLGLAAATVLSVGAQDVYCIYPLDKPATDNDIDVPTDFYIWGNMTSEEHTDAQMGKYATWTATADGWFGAGYLTTADFDFTPIKEMGYELVFDLKTSNNYSFRLKFEVQDTNGATIAANEEAIPLESTTEWQTVRVNLQKTFPQAFEAIAAGRRVYCFCPVGNGQQPGDYLSFTNVRFEPYQAPAAVEAGTTWYGEQLVFNGMPAGKTATVDYKVVVNEDQTFSVYYNVGGTEGIEGMVAPQCNIAGDWFTAEEVNEGGYQYKVTSTASYVKGDLVNCFFYAPYSGGAGRVDFSYQFGASNSQPQAVPVLSAMATEVGKTTAVITYEVTLPEALKGASVKVYADDTELSASPWDISGLTPATAYEYSLHAVATLDGKDYDSNAVKVSFTTLRDGGADLVYNKMFKATLDNVWIDGKGSADDRENLTCDFNYSITYTTDGSLKVVLTPLTEDFNKVVGIVPQLFINNGYSCNLDREGNNWVATPSGTYTMGEALPVAFFFAYNGGAARYDVEGYKVGDSFTVGINGVEAAASTGDVYTLTGVRVLRNADADALRNLPAGIYIHSGKKIVVR